VDQAVAAGRVDVPEESVVFTVKLPTALARRVRAHARENETTISAVVVRALTEFLQRGRRQHPRR
jgi:predicted transcriptional regulator